jgi:hypothetical protein
MGSKPIETCYDAHATRGFIMRALASIVTAVILTQAGTLQFTAPATWKSRAAASSMRVAEFVVPRVAGDAEDAEVVVYFFGGSGGSVDANIERWVGQFRTETGGPVPAPARTSSTSGRLKITGIDVAGTYVAEVRPGAAERFNKPNFRMRAAVVETPKGPYFVKFTGPARTVTQTAGDFEQFVKSLRFE